MRYEELPIYAKVDEMTAYMDRRVVDFPKEYKYSYGEDLRLTGIATAGLRSFHLSNKFKKSYAL